MAAESDIGEFRFFGQVKDAGRVAAAAYDRHVLDLQLRGAGIGEYRFARSQRAGVDREALAIDNNGAANIAAEFQGVGLGAVGGQRIAHQSVDEAAFGQAASVHRRLRQGCRTGIQDDEREGNEERNAESLTGERGGC